MTAEYTPTTDDVRRYWIGGVYQTRLADGFDRWFAGEIRKAKAEAWADGHNAGLSDGVAHEDFNRGEWPQFIATPNPYEATS